jgi:hypothetical protein
MAELSIFTNAATIKQLLEVLRNETKIRRREKEEIWNGKVKNRVNLALYTRKRERKYCKIIMG